MKIIASELAKIVCGQKTIDPNCLEHLECFQTTVSHDKDGNLACLYQIQKGFMEESHGIEVAKNAGKFKV